MPTAPRLLPRAEDPPAPAAAAAAGPGPGGQAQVLRRPPPSKVARHWPALRVEGAEALAGGFRLARLSAPYYPSGDGEEVKGGRRGRRQTQAPPPPPPPPPASNLPSLSRPRPVTHCPRLTSWAASEQEGGGEHEQEKHKQAGEESHGATRPVSSPRPRMLSAAPAVMALLFIRAPGGEGRGTYYARTFVTPPLLAGEGRQRGYGLSAVGYADGPGSHVASCRPPRFPRESASRFGRAGDLRFDACSALPVPLQLIDIINGYFI